MRQLSKNVFATSISAAGLLPVPDDLIDLGNDLFAIAQDHKIEEIGDGLGVVGAMPPGDDQRMLRSTVGASHWYASQINHVEQVRVGEFSRKVESDEIEQPCRSMTVERKQRNVSIAKETFKVGPRCVGPLSHRVWIFVENFVEDLKALIGQTDFVGVGVRQQPRHLLGGMARGTSSLLKADVASRFRYLGQEGLQLGPHIGHDP